MRDTFVLFLDMLGLKALFNEEGSDIEGLEPIVRSANEFGRSPAPNLLAERFINFHRCLNLAGDRATKQGAGTMIIFSDSAFLQVDSPSYMLSCATKLMESFIRDGVPVRMGIARGSFRALRFDTREADNTTYHTSQFLGTAVWKAHAAESCGAKGLRVFVDSSFEPCLDNSASNPQRLPLPRTCNGVGAEFNYLHHFYAIASSEKASDAVIDELLLSNLKGMAIETEGDAREQYTETLRAWNRMRAQIGRPAFPDVLTLQS
jgi:hypothetical protein